MQKHQVTVDMTGGGNGGGNGNEQLSMGGQIEARRGGTIQGGAVRGKPGASQPDAGKRPELEQRGWRDCLQFRNVYVIARYLY